MIKLIYIAGDGRSGSTLLDSVLSNINDSISVGECHRFWIRFYERETLCGCSQKIEECELWKEVNKRLKEEFSDYNPSEFKRQVKEIQYFKNFKKIPEIINSEEWKPFCQIVISFYKLIAEITEKRVIIDSSKSISWAYLLQNLNFCDLRIIHLERNLPAVANSWKKTVLLPEYYDKEVFMPKKSNYLILKSWLKIKSFGKRLKDNGYYIFISYEELCENQGLWLKRLQNFVDENFDGANLKIEFNHAIGGNPMRSDRSKTFKIQSKKEILNNLNFIEKFYFSLINYASKKIL